MKILHISSTDLIGGRFTGYYMQRVLDPREHQIEMAVWDKQSDNPAVHSLVPQHKRVAKILNKIALKVSDKLGLEGLTGLGSYQLTRKPFFDSADILHLHLIHGAGFFNILDLPRLSQLKPLVWTIHDFWPLSGMCIYPFDCPGIFEGCDRFCPYPRGESLFRHYIPGFHMKLKGFAYGKSNIHLVIASNWLLQRVKQSLLLRNFHTTLIPFGIDVDQFQAHSKEKARAKLGIPLGDHVISMRAASKKYGYYSYLYKGVEWLQKALEIYQPRKPTTILIFQDAREFQHLHDKYRIVNLPWVDGDDLVDALSATDVFLMPSIQETFGVMAVEAMACGVPVIVSEGTSLPEVIQAPKGGIVVPSKDSEALASAIDLLLGNDELRSQISKTARNLALEQYSLPLYVNRHLDLYQSILDQNGRVYEG